MENILLTNVHSRSYRTTFQGREYLVAPAILMVSGVLNGSKGPLYYPPEEVAADAQRWNGMPIVVYHPTLNGTPVSGRNPTVLEKSGIGFVANTIAKQYRGKDGKTVIKLRAETWYDIERTKTVDMRVWDALEKHTPIELSTGLFTDNIPVENSEEATYNGISYNHVARNYRPDHLAILPDQVGACSLKDGCGVLINSDGSKSRTVHNAGEIKDTDSTLPSSIGDTDMNKQELVNWITLNCDCWKEPTDKDTLNSFSEAKLQKMKAAIEKSKQEEVVANAARKGLEDKSLGIEVKFDETKKSLVANSTKKAETKPATTTPVDDKSGVNIIIEQPATSSTPTTTTNNNTTTTTETRKDKPMTEEEWLATAPVSVQKLINNAKAVETRERNKLIDQIVANANLDEANKAKLVKRFKDKDIEELQDYLLLTANAAQHNQHQHNSQQAIPHYLGDPAVTTNNQDGFDPNDVLPIPTINWAEEASERWKNQG